MKIKNPDYKMYLNDDLLYAYDNGYLEPEDLLEDPKDVLLVTYALEVVQLFKDALQQSGKLEEY